MLRSINNDLNEEILIKACEYIDKDINELHKLEGFENFLYTFDDKIIRLTHSRHRTKEQVKAEIEFIEYLLKYDVKVSEPVKLNNGMKTVTINYNKDYFTICCFKVEGDIIKIDDFNNDLIYNYGKALGKIHYLSKSYKPRHKREVWHDELYLNEYLINFSENNVEIVETLNIILEDIRKIPMTIENYGLIHNDLHRGNFLVKDNDIVVFDFDDSCYMYYISDIAIILFNFFIFEQDDHEPHEVEHFYEIFMEGYNSENTLPSECFYNMKLFLELRRLEIYAICVGAYNNDNRPDWASNYIKKYKERISERDHVIKLDFHR